MKKFLALSRSRVSRGYIAGALALSIGLSFSRVSGEEVAEVGASEAVEKLTDSDRVEEFSQDAASGDAQAEVVVEPSTNDSAPSIGAVLLRALLGRGKTESAAKSPSNDVANATHQQTATFKLSDDEHPEKPVHTFCLDRQGQLLAGCGEAPGVIRVVSAEGKIAAEWEVPITPESLHVGDDNLIYVAGDGRLLQLNSAGEILKNVEAPHLAAIESSTDTIRKELIEQQKSMALMYTQMREQMEKQIETLDEQLAELKEAETPDTSRIQSTERRRETYAKRVDTYRQMEEQAAGEGPSDEVIAERVEAMKRSKRRVASISTTDEAVFVACGAKEGYGFDVWKMNRDFEQGTIVVSGLRGCCGQMDVKANDHGIYVAENARHRVCCYDNEGKELTTWGKSDREGTLPDGFGSCCNPMNVTFGVDGSVYTAESTTGRIKRFDASGKYLDTIGLVELVPGCKNVSIAATSDGARIYMLAITRGHIVVMGRKAEVRDNTAQAEPVADSETR